MGQMIKFKRPDGTDCNAYLAGPAERTTNLFANHLK